MNNRFLVLRQLDKQLNDWQALRAKSPRPKFGWVKTIRKALGMTADDLARRLGRQRQRIVQLEHAEMTGGITLRTLQNVAEAMDCTFVYAIVPKKSSLENIVQSRAYSVAVKRVERVASSMALEAQNLQDEQKRNQIEELTKNLLEHSWQKLWKPQ